MKKLQAFLLALIICTSFIFSSIAIDKITDPTETAIGMVSACTEVMYLYKDISVEKYIADMSEATTATAVAADDKLGEVSAYASLGDSEYARVIEDFPKYITEKIEMYKKVRLERKVERRDFRAYYDVLDVSTDGNYAKVSLYERLYFYYDDSEEESFFGTLYDVYLRKSGLAWRVYDIASNDEFDSMHKTSGFDRDELMAEANYFTRTFEEKAAAAVIDTKEEESETELSDEGGLELQAVPIGDKDPSYLKYDPYAATTYAMTYTTSRENLGNEKKREFHNKNFYDYSLIGGDCQNFVSQCIYAGFGGSDDKTAISQRSFPMITTGSSDSYNWYGDSSGGHSPSWTAPRYFSEYVQRASKMTSGARIEAEVIGSFTTVVDWTLLREGDEVIFERGNHATIVSSIEIEDGTYSAHDIYFCSHTGDYKKKSLDDKFSAGGQIIRPKKCYFENNTPDGGKHTYSSVSAGDGFDSVCNTSGCGHCRMILTPMGCDPLPIGLSLSLYAECSGTAYRMAASVKTPSGKTKWLGEDLYRNDYSREYTFSEEGLYKITFFARDKNPSKYSDSTSVSAAVCIRIYDPDNQ